MRDIFFIIFGFLTIAGALGVVVAKQAIFSAFSLIVTFFGLAALYVLWGTSFIAMLQVLIYTGAIVVLFVFVVMLLNLKKDGPGDASSGFSIFFAGATVWCFSLLLLRTLNRATFFVSSNVATAQDIKSLAMLLFTKYLWAFEILSVFLLALIISVCILARTDNKKKVPS